MTETNSKSGKGRTLAQMIVDTGFLNVRDAALATIQLVRQISQLHSAGKVHCRISAHSVRIDEALSPELDPVESIVLIGPTHADSPPYPPQLLGIAPISLPADIDAARQVLADEGLLFDPRQMDFYQLAAVLCFMVSGKNVSDYLRSCRAKAALPATIRPVVDRALGMDATVRFENTDDFISELQAVASDESQTADGDLPFETLGHYRIVKRIGHGGMGDVYKAYENALERFVAIKVLPAELARQKDFVRRFHAEAAAIAKLDHPNIVQVYYSGEDRDHQFFAMQYVEGESLADVLARRGIITVSKALPIIRQCLAGLAAAHKQGLIHRDIKPGNVLLDRHGHRALLADFGVAKSLQSGTHCTTTGAVLGTADYIAPEQARGTAVDCRVDLYAMGILMYQMFSGRLPFEADSATSMMFQHAYEPPPPLAETAPDVPHKLAAVVMKLIEKRPEDRYQSSEDVLSDLRDVLPAGESADACAAATDEAPHFDCLMELPHDFSKLTGKNLFVRLLNKAVEFFGSRARKVVAGMQSTGCQVDAVVEDHQRRREKLVELAEQAATVSEQLHAQAQAARTAARAAAERARTAQDTNARHQALQEKQENELLAARLAQQQAEQAQLAEELTLHLAKADARLVQLHARRDALKARMEVANARLGDSTQASRFSRRKIAALSILLIAASAVAFQMFARGRSKTPDTSAPKTPAPAPTSPADGPVVFFDAIASQAIVVRDPQTTPEFVQSALGKPARIDYEGRMLRYPNYGLDFWFSGGGPLSEVHLNTAFKGVLDTGISLASTQQEVFAAYGKPARTLTATKLNGKNTDRILYQNGNTSRIYYRRHGLIFWFKDQNINQIVLAKGTIKE